MSPPLRVAVKRDDGGKRKGDDLEGRKTKAPHLELLADAAAGKELAALAQTFAKDMAQKKITEDRKKQLAAYARLYQDQKLSPKQVLTKVAQLFPDHPDIVASFAQFVAPPLVPQVTPPPQLPPPPPFFFPPPTPIMPPSTKQRNLYVPQNVLFPRGLPPPPPPAFFFNPMFPPPPPPPPMS